MVIYLERVVDLHMAQLMPLPLTVSCFSEIQIGFTFLVQAHPGSPGERAVKQVCVCVMHSILLVIVANKFCIHYKCSLVSCLDRLFAKSNYANYTDLLITYYTLLIDFAISALTLLT